MGVGAGPHPALKSKKEGGEYKINIQEGHEDTRGCIVFQGL